MNITRENIDALNAILKVEIAREDYEEKVDTVLKDYKKKATIKGFRPGKVPFGMIKKMYGPGVEVEEINKLVSESVSNYIAGENIEILGDPLPVQNEDIDFENRESFELSFEIGIAPEFELSLTAKNKLPYYEIKIDEKLRNEFLANYTRRYGEYMAADEVMDEDLIKGDVYQVDENGHQVEGGLFATDSSLSVSVIKDEKIKKDFIGRKKGDEVTFDIDTAYPSDFEKAGILQMKKEEAGSIKGIFRVKINTVNRFKHAEVNQELFDKIYGEGAVTSKDEFMKRLEEEIRNNLSTESDYKLQIDAKKLAIDKIKFDLPEKFLRKWLIKVNKDITEEDIDKDFQNFIEDLKWQLIRNRVAQVHEVKVEQEDLLNEARNYTRMQFRQYGLYYASDEQVDSFANEMLKREEEYKKIAEQVLEQKVIAKIKEMVKIETKKVSTEEFNKLFTN